MAESMFSPMWYRVSGLRPRLRTHGDIHRHDYRDEVWFVLQDHANGRYHRFTPEVNEILGAMDGERSVQELWERACETLGDDAPTQDEVIRLLGQLHSADMLQSDVTPDTLELFRRFEKSRQRRLLQQLSHPLAVRIPLIDPERFLERTLPVVRPLFSWLGFVLWATLIGWAGLLAAEHWGALTENVLDRAIAPQSLLAIWLTYPVIKAIHELGHAYATKHWGGEVHEMGVMLLVLVPVPYVDASAASAFRSKRQRIVVGAAGIMVELLLAALALFVWLNVEPGMVSAVAYSVMLIGGVSTLFFNGNPLLRFDGYYVFSDVVEIPNLANRAKAYLGYLVQRYVFGVKRAVSPVQADGERVWFVFYGVASFVYRTFILTVIIFFIAGQYFVIGALLAIWAVMTQLLVPLWKSVSFVLTHPSLSRHRRRAVAATTVAVVAVGILFAVPFPQRTSTEGVIWVPEFARVRAGSEGFVTDVVAPGGTHVTPGDLVIQMEDPLLIAQLALLEGRYRELAARLAEQQFSDRVAASVVRQEMETVSADLDRTRERIAALGMRSETEGDVAIVAEDDLPGRFVRRGEVLAYIIDDSPAWIRAVVRQDDIGLIRQGVTGVTVRSADYVGHPLDARLEREVPGGTFQLPTVALGSAGGGRLAVDPTDPEALRTLARVFQFDLRLVEPTPSLLLGQRVYVLFEHGRAPLAVQAYRSLRQLFLSRLGV